MPSDAPTAFFSYSRDDSEFALKLAEDLKAAGANVWLDQLELEAGKPWDVGIQRALSACPRVLAILSPSSVDSPNVLDEISFALRKQKTVIPVLYRDCEIPLRLERLQHVDFSTDYDRGLKVMLKTLAVKPVSEPPLAAAVPANPEERPDGPSQTHVDLDRVTTLTRQAEAGDAQAMAELGFLYGYLDRVKVLHQGRETLEEKRKAEEKAWLEREERERQAATEQAAENARLEQKERERQAEERALLEQEQIKPEAAEKSQAQQREDALQAAAARARGDYAHMEIGSSPEGSVVFGKFSPTIVKGAIAAGILVIALLIYLVVRPKAYNGGDQIQSPVAASSSATSDARSSSGSTANRITANETGATTVGSPKVGPANGTIPETKNDQDPTRKTSPEPQPVKAERKTATDFAPPAFNGFSRVVVQVAAVSREDDAIALAAFLRKKNYNVFIVNNPAKYNNEFYHVLVGPFATMNDAEVMKAKLIAAGYNPLIKDF